MRYRIEFDDDEFKDMQKDVLRAIFALRKSAYECDNPDLSRVCMESSILLKMVWDRIGEKKS